MVSRLDVIKLASNLGIKFDKFTLDDLIEGINIEMEHGMINPETNVTNDDLETTMKIALSHLNEYPNYYNKDYGLIKWEEFLKEKLND